jgi:hypothetical protein
VPSFPDVQATDAHALVTGFLHREPGGGWLPPDQTADLLHCYGIWLVDAEPAQSEDEAARAVEPMVTDGTEVTIGVTHDRVFGPLVVFGPGDHAARLTPLTDTDADALIRSVDAAPWLLGQRGVPATDLATLRELLLRVSRLADDLPELTEFELNPVIAKPHGVFAMDARIKLTPCPPQNPFLRRLRLLVSLGANHGSSKRRGRIVLAGDAAGALRPYGLAHGCDQLRGPDQAVRAGDRGERA